jgi:pimeloyl-ACP methyl ester carboxylesterase
MREKVLTFLNSSPLVGIITEPDAKKQMEQKPAVLFWNAGFLHRVGPYRLYVDMARKLAAMGFLAVRFDLSGKGDSKPRRDEGLEKDRAARDVREVMDLVSAKTGIEEFVLIGLCSGADDAFPIAVEDSRVSGLVLLDGFAYRTIRYYVPHYLMRIFIWQRWKNFISRKFHELFLHTERKVEDYIREFPPKAKVKQDLLHLIERGVNLLFVYSGEVKEYYNYKGQFKDMLKPIAMNEKLQSEYFDKATHTYTRLDDRKMLMTCICDWLNKHYNDSQK